MQKTQNAFLILVVSENLPPLYVYIINCCHEDTYALPVITYKLCSLYLKRSQCDKNLNTRFICEYG